eukprot:gene14728-16348_t
MHCYWVLLAFMVVTFYSKVQCSTLEIVQLEKLVEKNMNLIRLDKSLKVLTAPTLEPTEAPSEEPSEEPTEEPSSLPSTIPTAMPSGRPTIKPSPVPTVLPSAVPTVTPSAIPSSRPSSRPFSTPTSQPTAQPFSRPSGKPSSQPSSQPTNSPTAPSFRPTVSPTVAVTERSKDIVHVNTTYTFGSVNALQLNNVSIATITTVIISLAPKPSRVFVRRIYRIIAGTGRRLQPVQTFTYGADAFLGKVEAIQLENNALDKLTEKNKLSALHSVKSSAEDFHIVTEISMATVKRVQVRAVSGAPTLEPTEAPSEEPTEEPSEEPTEEPTSIPSSQPSNRPSGFPSAVPSFYPTSVPSVVPSSRPSSRPNSQPSSLPTCLLTPVHLSKNSWEDFQIVSDTTKHAPVRLMSVIAPTVRPTMEPTEAPSEEPSEEP